MKVLDDILLNEINGGFFFMPFIWGSILGAVAYAVNHKHDFNGEAFAVATMGGGVAGSFGPLGAAGRAFQVVNVINTAEAVNYVQNRE